MNSNANEPAFPHSGVYSSNGLSKREYFACEIAKAHLSNGYALERAVALQSESGRMIDLPAIYNWLLGMSIHHADALLSELAKGVEE